MKFYSILILFTLFFAACTSTKEVVKSKSYLVTVKTKNFAFSDAGFLKKSNALTNLQVFAAGKLIFDLNIRDNICVNGSCYAKENFNKEHLNYYYPKDILKNIINAKPIFKGQNLNKTPQGFSQEIQSNNYKIKYTVSNDKIYFKDSKNRIIIKLKGLKQL